MVKLYSFLMIAVMFSVMAFTTKQKPLQPILGTAVPDFQLPATDGKIVSLSNFASAKGFIIVFTSNTCIASKEFDSRLSQLNKWYEKKGFPLIAINSGEVTSSNRDNSLVNMADKVSRKKITYPYLSDSTQAVAKQYNIDQTPFALLIVKEDGKYISRYIGAIDGTGTEGGNVQDKYLADALDALIAGEGPQIGATKAIGCPLLSNKQ